MNAEAHEVGLLARMLAEGGHALAFNIIDLGARPAGDAEQFYSLLDAFPGSRISAIEVDAAVCAELNANAPAGLRYYPNAIARGEGTRTLYETLHASCSSLYEPDIRYADTYTHLDILRVKSTVSVRTTSLDAFVRNNALGSVDFIKLDVQGAELEVLQGGLATLSSVLAILSEVEFTPLYKGQPLYGDIDAFLRERDFTLHKFLSLEGRAVKPLMLNGNPNYPVTMMWADALFTCDLLEVRGFSGNQLLKLAVLLDLYGSMDAALYLLREYDRIEAAALAPVYREQVLAFDKWSETGAAR